MLMSRNEGRTTGPMYNKNILNSVAFHLSSSLSVLGFLENSTGICWRPCQRSQTSDWPYELVNRIWEHLWAKYSQVSLQQPSRLNACHHLGTKTPFQHFHHGKGQRWCSSFCHCMSDSSVLSGKVIKGKVILFGYYPCCITSRISIMRLFLYTKARPGASQMTESNLTEILLPSKSTPLSRSRLCFFVPQNNAITTCSFSGKPMKSPKKGHTWMPLLLNKGNTSMLICSFNAQQLVIDPNAWCTFCLMADKIPM